MPCDFTVSPHLPGELGAPLLVFFLFTFLLFREQDQASGFAQAASPLGSHFGN